MKHIGIVAGSSEGAALCYRMICHEASAVVAENTHPEISVHSHALSAYLEALDRNDIEGVGALLLSSAEKLARAGAQFAICPDNTMHQAFDFVVPRSPIPWLHIAGVVASTARDRGYRKVGLLGTKSLVESDVYPTKFLEQRVRLSRASASDIDEVDRIIMEELIHGAFMDQSTSHIVGVIERLKGEGCDAVILGCTELPLVISKSNSPLPTLNSTELLAKAALRHALDA